MTNDEEVWRKLVSSIDRTQLPNHVELLEKICTSVQASITRPPRSKEEMRAAFHTIKRAKAFWEGKLSTQEKEKLFNSSSTKVPPQPRPPPPPPVTKPKPQADNAPPPPSPSPHISQQDLRKVARAKDEAMRKQRTKVDEGPRRTTYESHIPIEDQMEDESSQAPPVNADFTSEEQLPPLSSATYFPDREEQGGAIAEEELPEQQWGEREWEDRYEEVQDEEHPPATTYYEAYYPEDEAEVEVEGEGEQYRQPLYQPEWEEEVGEEQPLDYPYDDGDLPDEQLPPLSSYATYLPEEGLEGEHGWNGELQDQAEYHEYQEDPDEKDEQLDLDQPLLHSADGLQYEEPVEETSWDEQVEYERPLYPSGPHPPDECVPPLSSYTTYFPGEEGGEYRYEDDQTLPLDKAEVEYLSPVDEQFDGPVDEYTQDLSQQDVADNYNDLAYDGYRQDRDDDDVNHYGDNGYFENRQGEDSTYHYPVDYHQDDMQGVETGVYEPPQNYNPERPNEEERDEAWREEVPQPKYVAAGLECHLAAEQEAWETCDDAAPSAEEQNREKKSLPSRPPRSTPPRPLTDLLAAQPITPAPTTAGKKRKEPLDRWSPSPPIRWIDDPLLQNPKWFDRLAASHPDPDQPTARVLANFALARDRTLLRALQAADFDLVERESAIQGADLLLSPGAGVLFRDLASLGKDLGKLMEDIDLASRHSTRVIVVIALVSYTAWERKDDGSPLEVDQLTDNVARGLSNIRSRLKYVTPGVNGVLGSVELVFAKHGAGEIAKVVKALHDEEQQRVIQDMPEDEARDWIERRWLSEDSTPDEELLITRHRINSFTAQYVLRIFGCASGIYSRPREQVRSFIRPVLGQAVTDRLLAPLANPQLAVV